MSGRPTLDGGHITGLNEANFAIILIHGGKNHHPSRLALEIWNKHSIDCMKDIEIVDNRVKQWLTCNDRVLNISEVPCIIFCKAGNRPIVYEIDRIHQIVRSVSKYSNVSVS